MQIGLRAPMSLSMRMRSESSVAASGSEELPRITSGAVGLTSTSSLGTTSSPGYQKKSKKEVQKKDEFRYPFERLSGSLDFVASSGVFADRSVMVNPAAVCVRCAEHASMCMSCTEILCQEALNFYRKTRARGAASLFANAITQTGVTKVVKAAVFKLWSNGLQYRKRREKKMAFVCDKAFRVSLMRTPFRAWRSYSKSELIERKNKNLEELEAKVAFLEQQVLKASAERSAFEQQARFVSSMLKERDNTIAQQAADLEHKAADLAVARRRITGLASLSGPLLALKDVVGELVHADSHETKSRLLRGASSIGPAHDYSKVYDNDTYRSLSKELARRKAAKHLTKLDETTEIISVLLQWATCKSRDANNVSDVKGQSLSDFLPKFRVIESMDDLTSAQHILRVVVAVIFEQTLSGKTTLRLPSLVDFVKAQNPDSEKADAINNMQLNEELVEDIKSPAKTQGEVATKALKLATKYLHMPSFNAKDITTGNAEVLLVLLGHLMIASASPAQHNSHVQRVGELIRAFESADEEVRRSHRSLGGIACDVLRARWEECVGLREPTEEVKPVTTSAAAPAPAEVLSGEVVGTGAAAGDGSGEEDASGDATPLDAGSASTAQAAAAPPTKVPEDPDAKYNRLLQAVDAVLEAAGDPVNKECPGGRLQSQVGVLSEAVEGATAVRGSLATLEQTRDAGVRLASEVRAAVAAMQYELMLEQLHWAVH